LSRFSIRPIAKPLGDRLGWFGMKASVRGSQLLLQWRWPRVTSAIALALQDIFAGGLSRVRTTSPGRTTRIERNKAS